MIRIIHAKEDHLPAVLRIENASIKPPWTEGALLGEVGRDDGLFALAIADGVFIEDGVSIADGPTADDGGVLGFCIVRCAADEAELYQIAVCEGYRRHGVADSLMNAAKQFCRQNRIGSVYLEVRRSNEAAIRLYRKHGFKNQGRRKNYYSSPVEDAVLMSLALALDQDTKLV